MAKLVVGINDLATLHPEVAAEADGWDASTVFAGSNKRMSWKCSLGHKWETDIKSRTQKNTGCPYCRNVKVWIGFNDLKTKFPEIAKQACGWDPSTVIGGSHKKMNWKCSKGHTWEAEVVSRTSGIGCPYCSNTKVWAGFNDLATFFPEVANEADDWDPSTVTSGSHKKMTWKCSIGHRWQAVVKNRTQLNQGCPYCANKKVLAGFNDLKTLFPEVAKEANGWDPSTVVSGSSKRLSWKCEKGHTWETTLSHRTLSKSGCPYCSNSKVWEGFNDLETTSPDLAKEAEGWDPRTVHGGSSKKMSWKCSKGHIWQAPPNDRTGQNQNGCPYCANKKVLAGFNDLKTLFPEVAKQACGWDPSTLIGGSKKKVKWKCQKGHEWEATIGDRTGSHKSGCPYCSHKKLLVGFNDLGTTTPEIAKEACGWDPSTLVAGTKKKMLWKCDQGHTWKTSPHSRTGKGNTGCPYCANKKVLEGFNDLASTFPDLAKEADGWDPKNFVFGSFSKQSWLCDKGHKWKARLISRTGKNKSGCPVCAERGFNPEKPAWFYLMQRPNEQQFGITNHLKDRMLYHARKGGWKQLDKSAPNDGYEVQEIEQKLKQWLKKEIGVVPDKTENWYTSKMEVHSLAELKEKSGIETSIF